MNAAISKTRSDGGQLDLRDCPYCHVLFQPKRARQTFCSDKCKGEHFRDVGVQVKVISHRQLKSGSRLIVNADTFMDAPPGSRFRLVRVP